MTTRQDIIPNSEDVLLGGASVGGEGGGGCLLKVRTTLPLSLKSLFKKQKDGRERSKRKHSLFDFSPSLLLAAHPVFHKLSGPPPPPFSSVTNKKGQTVNKIFLYNSLFSWLSGGVLGGVCSAGDWRRLADALRMCALTENKRTWE